MSVNISKTLKRMVRRVWNDTPDPYEKAEILTVLIGVFGTDYPETIKRDVENLNRVLPLLNEQKELQNALDQSTSKHFYWDPGLDRPRHNDQQENDITTLTLSPSFHVECDVSGVIGQMEAVRTGINDLPVNYSVIINWILDRAKAEGVEIAEDD